MRKRTATSVKLTAMLLVLLISTGQSIVAAEWGPDGAEYTGTEYTGTEPEKSGPKPSASLSKVASERAHTVKATVERALPYLARAGEAWIEKRKCVSCHQVPFMLWSLSAADAQGYPIDRSRLKKWAAWSTEVRNFVKPAQKPDVELASTLAANIDTLNALLLGIPAQPQASPDKASGHAKTGDRREATAWRNLFVDALVKNQQEEGGWKPCGQLPAQKRSLEETTQVTTAWTLLALDGNQTTANREQKALTMLQNTSPASTEWWAVNLLLAAQRSEMNASALCDALIEKQQADGGWGWLTSDPSDALATGMAIYALSQYDAEQNKSAISKAVAFLTTSQSPDGSWKVPGTKKTTRNQPTPTSNYWGTAWAVIGLLESES